MSAGAAKFSVRVRDLKNTIRRLPLLLACALVVTHAHAGDKVAFKIAAGSAPQALAEFVRQSGLQVLFDFDAIRNFNTHEVSGQFDAAEALARMFAGSELTFEFINDRTIAVHPRAPAPVPVIQSEPKS